MKSSLVGFYGVQVKIIGEKGRFTDNYDPILLIFDRIFCLLINTNVMDLKTLSYIIRSCSVS